MVLSWQEACRKRLKAVGLCQRFDHLRKRWSVKGDGAMTPMEAFNAAWADFLPAVEALEALPDAKDAAALQAEAEEMAKEVGLEDRDYTQTSIHDAMRWAVQHMGLKVKKDDCPSPLAYEMLGHVSSKQNRSKVMDLTLKLAQMEDDGKGSYSDDGRGFTELLDDSEKAFLGELSVLSPGSEASN